MPLFDDSGSGGILGDILGTPTVNTQVSVSEKTMAFVGIVVGALVLVVLVVVFGKKRR